MISFDEALDAVLGCKKDFGTQIVPLLQSSGRILAEEVFADRDFPPYDRVMMDGIAINAESFKAGTRRFNIQSIQAAGAPQQVLLNLDNCIEVMTGSVVPENADVIIPYEQCEMSLGTALVKTQEVQPMQNVHRQGTDSKNGQLLLSKGVKLTPAMTGILASVGVSAVEVLRHPKIAIFSTGDELVDISNQPLPHQVRRSNVYMLAAALQSEGIESTLVHVADDPFEIKQEVAALLKNMDVILFSGAVSKGKFDHLPAVLSELGMHQVFHSVAQRPGKPFLFGQFAEGPLIFGFPGNPVSTFACYHQFFKRWLHASLYRNHQPDLVILDTQIRFTPALSCHRLVKVSNKRGILYATPVVGSSSGDLVTLTEADGLITLPAHRELFEPGEVFEFNFCR